MSLTKDLPIRPPVWTESWFDREQASRFGTLAAGDIRRCLVATYEHCPEERQALLDRDLRCAIGVARTAWRYGLRVLQEPCILSFRGCTRIAETAVSDEDELLLSCSWCAEQWLLRYPEDRPQLTGASR